MGTLIELYMVRGKSDDALSELQTLATRRPNLVAPHMLMGTIYHSTLARDPEAVKRLPNGQAWLDSVSTGVPHKADRSHWLAARCST